MSEKVVVSLSPEPRGKSKRAERYKRGHLVPTGHWATGPSGQGRGDASEILLPAGISNTLCAVVHAKQYIPLTTLSHAATLEWRQSLYETMTGGRYIYLPGDQNESCCSMARVCAWTSRGHRTDANYRRQSGQSVP